MPDQAKKFNLLAFQGVNYSPLTVINVQHILYVKTHIMEMEASDSSSLVKAKRYGEIHIVHVEKLPDQPAPFGLIKSYRSKRYFDELLKEYGCFFSISQSATVNLHFIEKINKRNSSVMMHDGASIAVSEHRMDSLLRLFIIA